MKLKQILVGLKGILGERDILGEKDILGENGTTESQNSIFVCEGELLSNSLIFKTFQYIH